MYAPQNQMSFPTTEIMCDKGMAHGVNPIKSNVKFPRPWFFECETCAFYSLTRKCLCIRDSGD